MSQDILYKVKDRVAIITINIPKKLNALTREQYLEMGKYMEEANEDDDVVITLLQATGNYFSVGANFQEKGIAKLSTDQLFSHEHWLSHFVGRNVHITDVFSNHKKVLVAALNGPIIGLSASLVALCDLIYAKDENDVYLSTPFSTLGLVAEGAASATFFNRLGWSTASEAILLAKKIPGPRLSQLGFINKSYHDHKFKSTEEFNAQVHKDLVTQFEDLHDDSILKNKQLLKANRDQIVQSAASNEAMRGFYKWIEGVPQTKFAQLMQKEIKHKL